MSQLEPLNIAAATATPQLNALGVDSHVLKHPFPIPSGRPKGVGNITEERCAHFANQLAKQYGGDTRARLRAKLAQK
jgi:hypothetical protein